MEYKLGDHEKFRRLPRLGIYEHFKSTPEQPKYYEVLEFLQHHETGEVLVKYRPIDADETELAFIRPMVEFVSSVEVDGRHISRFSCIG